MKTESELKKEAKERGYRKGSIIHYYPERQSQTDRLEGDYFEMDEFSNLNAYKKSKNNRVSFDDFTHDEIYNSQNDRWVKLIKK